MTVKKHSARILVPLFLVVLLLSACMVNQVERNRFDGPADPGVVEDLTTDRPINGMLGDDIADLWVSATGLIGTDFQNNDGEVTGTIQDLILDGTTGDVLYATVEYGGFLDIGDTELVMPLAAFTWGANNELILNVDAAQLEDFPELSADWLEPADPVWDDAIVAFWRGAEIDPGVEYTQASQSVARLSEVLDYGLSDLGLGVGNFIDLLIDLDQGDIAYALISYEPGIYDNDLIAVPFAAFTISTADNELSFAAGVDAAVIEDAPLYSSGPYTTANAETMAAIDRYWQDLGFAAGAPAVSS